MNTSWNQVQRKLESCRIPSDEKERLSRFAEYMLQGKIPTLAYLLPLLLNLNGKPYSLEHHYQFEPIFRTRRPKKTLLLAGRQVSKTTTEAADGVVQANCLTNFSILFVCPLFEQVRRLSTDRVHKFIQQSPIRHLWTSSQTENSVLRRTFTNGSTMHFSYAFLNAERIRSISADKICFDEVQDIDRNHIPVIMETMSHSPWAWTQFAGTPKTPENTIHGLWLASSQAEWCIPCSSCKHDNVCSTEFDLLKILGPVYDSGNDPFFGTVCAKCRRTIDPKTGFWLHRYPNRRWDFAGYHIPQPIMHIHYSNPDKWSELLAKQQGQGNYTPARFYNEVLGESYGQGCQLVTLAELQKAACLPWSNTPDDPQAIAEKARQYEVTVLAVDWGGGGAKKIQDSDIGISLTTLALLAWNPQGTIDVLWGKRLLTPHDHLGEARTCLELFRLFGCRFLAHDFSGAGSLRETFLVHNSLDVHRILPIAYVGATRSAIMKYCEPTDYQPRAHYVVDKTRSLLLTCAAIKTGRLRFFAYDYVSPDNPGLLHDFFGLVENKVSSAVGSDLYTIQRHALLSDDFAQAVNIGCCALWHIHQSWPNFSETSQPSVEHGSLLWEQENLY